MAASSSGTDPRHRIASADAAPSGLLCVTGTVGKGRRKPRRKPVFQREAEYPSRDEPVKAGDARPPGAGAARDGARIDGAAVGGAGGAAMSATPVRRPRLEEVAERAGVSK